MAPVETVESAIVPIGADPGAARFNRNRCQKCVRNEIAAAARFSHQPGEDRPMPWPGRDQDMLCGFANRLNELKRKLPICWWIEYFWMGYDTQKTAKHQICHPEGLRSAE
jgi:hypothetical protein